MEMEWSATSATNAYLDTLKLCSDYKTRCDSRITQEPGINEFISALAAGMRAKLIVEVSPGVSPSTIALAAAAQQTEGRFVCIVPEAVLAESERVIKYSGLKDIVEFKTGEPSEQLSTCGNIGFSLVDCKNDDYTRLLSLLGVNLEKSVVIAKKLVCQKQGLRRHFKGMENKVEVSSVKLPIWKSMEIILIGRSNDMKSRERLPKVRRVDERKRRNFRSRWVVKVDEESGEEHIFRVQAHFDKE